jgi:hypothetical protein
MIESSDPQERHLRRAAAAKYIEDTHNVPCSEKTLAKLACVSSDGPPFRMAGRFPLYPVSGLDAWVRAKIGPLVHSTSEARTVAHPGLSITGPSSEVNRRDAIAVPNPNATVMSTATVKPKGRDN